jgi:hypothetical protein
MKRDQEEYLQLLRAKAQHMRLQEKEALRWQEEMAGMMSEHSPDKRPPYHDGTDYCRKFWKLYIFNELMILKIKDMLA